MRVDPFGGVNLAEVTRPYLRSLRQEVGDHLCRPGFAHGIGTIKAIFDACDRERLRALKPLTQIAGERATLFRGCAGPVHTLGMSWTSSLDKAIWYAAHHATYYDLSDCAVYVTTMPVSEIYCCLDHYDHDCIAYPPSAWRVDVPAQEFRLDRPR